jgi:hypothetical protein
MTTQPSESATALQDMINQTEVMASAYRDANLPDGSTIGETEIHGQQVKWKKPRSMVRAGATPLPERFEAFDKFGNSSMLPTAQLGRMLSKPRADSPGERAFHTHTSGKTRELCSICPTPKQPIDETCEFCLERTAGSVRKVFYSESSVYAHKNAFHHDEFAAVERTLERAERRAQIDAQNRVADAMLAAVQAREPVPAAKTGGKA